LKLGHKSTLAISNYFTPNFLALSICEEDWEKVAPGRAQVGVCADVNFDR